MTMYSSRRLLVSAGLAVMTNLPFITGCQKHEVDRETETASDNARAESAFTDLFNLSGEAMRNRTPQQKKNIPGSLLGSCATVDYDSLDPRDPDTLFIDFGPVNCQCNDTRNRRGKLWIVYTGKYEQPGTIITIKPVNYYLNDNLVEGIKTIVNRGVNSRGNLVFTAESSGSVGLASGFGTIRHSSSHTCEWVSGSETVPETDDVYSITGSAEGIGARGRKYTARVVQPLVKGLSCRHFLSGTAEIVPEGKAARVIDYGSGMCDNEATVIIRGKKFKIYLR